MRLLRFDPVVARAIEHHGSVEMTVSPLTRVRNGPVACIRLEAGGRIGRHPAASAQLLAIVAGSGYVSGADGVELEAPAGTAALWEPGEDHETRTETGLTAIVIEGDDLATLAADGPAPLP